MREIITLISIKSIFYVTPRIYFVTRMNISLFGGTDILLKTLKIDQNDQQNENHGFPNVNSSSNKSVKQHVSTPSVRRRNNNNHNNNNNIVRSRQSLDSIAQYQSGDENDEKTNESNNPEKSSKWSLQDAPPVLSEMERVKMNKPVSKGTQSPMQNTTSRRSRGNSPQFR